MTLPGLLLTEARPADSFWALCQARSEVLGNSAVCTAIIPGLEPGGFLRFEQADLERTTAALNGSRMSRGPFLFSGHAVPQRVRAEAHRS
jgi:hypothetical protein